MTAAREGDVDGAIVVWMAHVPALRDSMAALEELLDARERERAGKFHFVEDRERYVAGRGLLRHALRLYAPGVPDSLELGYSPLGRPLLPAGTPLAFSISHSREITALALTRQAQVGIDIEYMRPDADIPALAERVLSDEDFMDFQSLPEQEKQAAFYRIWTRKEAYLKAHGEGITTGLGAVHVPFGPETIGVPVDRRDPAATHWRLHAVPVPAGYAGAVACDDPEFPVRFFDASVERGEIRLGAKAGSG